jgi:hypothetical protein
MDSALRVTIPGYCLFREGQSPFDIPMMSTFLLEWKASCDMKDERFSNETLHGPVNARLFEIDCLIPRGKSN